MNGNRLLTVAVPLAVAAAVLLPATAARAAPVGDYLAGGTNIRNGPHTTSGVLGVGYQGQGATVYCWLTGDVVSGDSTWLYNRDNATGVTGYSAAAAMSFSGGVPHC